MNEKTMDMTKGSIMPKLIRFALPVLLGMLFQRIYNFADVYIVGKFLGDDALVCRQHRRLGYVSPAVGHDGADYRCQRCDRTILWCKRRTESYRNICNFHLCCRRFRTFDHNYRCDRGKTFTLCLADVG